GRSRTRTRSAPRGRRIRQHGSGAVAMISLFQAPPSDGPRLSFATKLWQINWLLVVLVTTIAGIGWIVLYSAADASLEPWAGRQMYRFSAGMAVMLAMGFVDIRFYLRWAYLVYIVAFVLLIA